MRKLFYGGKRKVKGQTTENRRPTALLVSVILIFTLFVGGALAWLIHGPIALINTFTPGTITTTIVEKREDNEKSDVRIKNTGNVDAFIRADIIVNWVDAKGDVVSPAAGDSYIMDGLPGSNWFRHDDVYYYELPVAADALTGNLFDKCVPVNGKAPAGADHLQVIILAQGIQTTQEAVKAAWGSKLTIDSSGHLAAG